MGEGYLLEPFREVETVLVHSVVHKILNLRGVDGGREWERGPVQTDVMQSCHRIASTCQKAICKHRNTQACKPQAWKPPFSSFK